MAQEEARQYITTDWRFFMPPNHLRIRPKCWRLEATKLFDPPRKRTPDDIKEFLNRDQFACTIDLAAVFSSQMAPGFFDTLSWKSAEG